MSAPSPCPYVRLSGLRRMIEIKADQMIAGPVPDGSPVGDPFE
jgi:hypothetical protein